MDRSKRSFICVPTLCALRWAGRSAEDRLLCKQEVLGSNPSRSIPLWVQKGRDPPFLEMTGREESESDLRLSATEGGYRVLDWTTAIGSGSFLRSVWSPDPSSVV